MSINQIRFRPLSWIKQLLIKKGRRPYKVRYGLYRGLTLNLNLQYETQLYLGLYERETYTTIRTAARACDWIIDIGAGKGELCLYFLKNSCTQKVLAFEPDPEEIYIMQSNLTLNNKQNSRRISIFKKYVGTENNPNFISLDSLNLEKSKKGFIKIDVDGNELDILESGKQLLSYANIGLLIETHSRKLEDKCLQWLKNKGYTYKIIPNAWWRFMLPEKRPIKHNRWLQATKK